ncbi:MAG: hypothetical protein EA351_09445 [Gemmatimonadales bacterium]|nr:MAG: hypothetical protein EA351_09445 [Gemmatimonadales bacterium]
MTRNRNPDRTRLAPSIQKAHRRVLFALVASGAHSAILLGIAAYLFFGVDAEGMVVAPWLLGGVALVGAVVVPLLGRASYRGNSFAALLLLLTSIVPPVIALLAGRDPTLTLFGLLAAPFYFVGARGAIGLRGRRGSRRK